MKKSQTVISIILIFLIHLFITASLISCSSAEQETRVYFGTEEMEQTSSDDQSSSMTITPGHVIIGQIAPKLTSTVAISEEYMSVYTKASGATMVIKNYASDKALIDAARSGEIDIVYGNNLVSFILGCENALVDLEPALEPLLADGEYYTNIIDAGRMEGKLYMVTPQFSVGSCIAVPEGAVEEFGVPTDFTELLTIFDTLEPEYRSDSVSGMEHIHGALDLKGRSFDISPFWNGWTTLRQKQEEDQKISKLFTDEEVYHALFAMSAGRYFDPITYYSYYVKKDGTVYTKYGAKGCLIPYTYQEDIGFSNYAPPYSIPVKAQNQSAALHLIQWLLSEEGQETGVEKGAGCPLMKSKAQRFFLFYRHGKEIMYTVEEEQAIVEGYIAEVDHVPAYSSILRETIEQLLDGGCLDKDNREREIDFIMAAERSETWSVLIEFLKRFDHEEAIPRFYQEDAADFWPELLNEYVRAYIGDLGYEMH